MARIAIGADHAGFELKSHLVDVLRDGGHDVVDHGTDSTAAVDYPPICAAVGRTVRDGATELGIVLGGSGQGEQLVGQQGARRAGGAVQRPLHGPHGPRPQRRQRAVDRAPASSASAWPRRSSPRSSPPTSRAAATPAGSPRSPTSNRSSDRAALCHTGA